LRGLRVWLRVWRRVSGAGGCCLGAGRCGVSCRWGRGLRQGCGARGRSGGLCGPRGGGKQSGLSGRSGGVAAFRRCGEIAGDAGRRAVPWGVSLACLTGACENPGAAGLRDGAVGGYGLCGVARNRPLARRVMAGLARPRSGVWSGYACRAALTGLSWLGMGPGLCPSWPPGRRLDLVLCAL